MTQEMEKRRFSYVLNDIEVAKTIGKGLNPHEILLDYDNNDIIIIGEDLEELSLHDLIRENNSNFITKDHIKSDNQHLLVTENNNGFMSSKNYKNLCDIDGYINYLKESISISVQNNPFIVKEINYTIVDNTLVIDNLLLENGFYDLKLENENIELSQREDECRTELIYLSYDGEKYQLMYDYNKVVFKQNIINIADKTLIYDTKRHIYTDGINILIPLLKINRNNNKEFSELNKDGFIESQYIDYNEIIDICRYRLPVKSYDTILDDFTKKINKNFTHPKIFKTNIVPDNPKALCSILMNGNCTDSVSNTSFNREMIYTPSPFGKMMRCASGDSDLITFKSVNNFVLEFMLNSSFIDHEELLCLYNEDIEDIIHVGILDNKLIISINNTFIKTQLNIDKEFFFVKILIKNNTMSLYINEILIETKILSDMKPCSKIELKSCNTAIGNILITNDLQYKNKYINDVVELVPSFKAITFDDVLYEVNKKINVFDNSDNDMDMQIKLANYNKISAGDTLKIKLGDNLVNYYNNDLKVNDIVDNILTVNNNNFKKGDNLVIFKNATNIIEYCKVIDIIDNELYIDKIITDNIIGCYISSINDSYPIKIYAGDILLSNVYKHDDYITILFDKEYDLHTQFELYYIKKNKKNCLNNIVKNINKVNYNGIQMDSVPDLFIHLNRNDISCNYNDEVFEFNKVEKHFKAFVNDKIKLELSINMKDFFNINDLPMEILNQFLYLNAIINLSSGENEVSINGTKYNRGNIVSEYILDNIKWDENGIVKIIIETQSSKDNAIILFNDIRLYINTDSKLFFKKNEVGTIDKFLIYNRNGVFTNIDSELDIYVDEYDNDILYHNALVRHTIAKHNDCELIKDYFGLAKLIYKNKIYHLDKNYIV